MTTQEQMNEQIVRALGDMTDALRAICDRIDQVNRSTSMGNEHLAELTRIADGAGLILTKAFIDEDGEPILDGIQFGILNHPIHLPAEGDEEESSFILASDVWAQRAEAQEAEEEARGQAQKRKKADLANKRRPKTTETAEEPKPGDVSEDGYVYVEKLGWVKDANEMTEPVAMEKTVAGWEEGEDNPEEATFRVEE